VYDGIGDRLLRGRCRYSVVLRSTFLLSEIGSQYIRRCTRRGSSPHHCICSYTTLPSTNTMRYSFLIPLFSILVLFLSTTVSAQGFFEQFFSGGGPQHQGPPQNAPSDAKHYAEMFDNSMSLQKNPLPSRQDPANPDPFLSTTRQRCYRSHIY